MRKMSGGLLFRLSLIVFSIITITLSFIVLMCGFVIRTLNIHFASRVMILGVRVSTFTVLLTIAITTLIISLTISLFVLRIYLKPINELKIAMNKVAKGKFEVLEEQNEAQEINELIVSYNKMVKELKHIETIAEEYTANISHEFKTPLTTIKGYLDLLSMDDISVEERDEYLSIIRIANERLIGLTNNILLLNKLGNKEIITVNTFSLDNQIREALILFESKWNEKNINVSIDLDEFIIESNEELLMSIWSNILSNAVKFTKENGNIGVSLKTEGSNAIVTIKDDGIGMSEESLKHIFKKFYQVDRSHKLEGNGLGLALVEAILDKVKGSVEVKSKLNEGTTFIIKLRKKAY